jgi:dolichol-phosphate mannosyltransferase
MKYDITVIIPTYKEEENIGDTILEINSILKISDINGQILVVDDNSPDKTKTIVQGFVDKMENVNLCIRFFDKGLSQSVVDGISESKSDIILVTDADRSHDLSLIPSMYNKIKEGSDVVIGSRYMKGGGIKKWSLKRRIISIGATFLGRLILPDITDPVSGFFAMKKDVIKNVVLKPTGYKILFEILGKGVWTRFVEVPYEFTDRKVGESKLKLKTIVEYVQQVIDIAWYSLWHHDSAAWREWIKVLKFCVVGSTGIIINMGVLYALKEFVGVPLLISSFIAIELSIINNFIWNDLWTFNQKFNDGRSLTRLLEFHMVSITGLVINIGMLYAFTSMGVYYMVANMVGILCGFVWNFMANRRITWVSEG